MTGDATGGTVEAVADAAAAGGEYCTLQGLRWSHP